MDEVHNYFIQTSYGFPFMIRAFEIEDMVINLALPAPGMVGFENVPFA